MMFNEIIKRSIQCENKGLIVSDNTSISKVDFLSLVL